ncbi:hypothetical protein [Criblamydia sequanensis]|uniref:Uncharacterized protein n=1 Tax=Candidatus Criblamydia sequanensis CRIB-18 TaxID=1437425 RepID=A0A090D0U5_9BACT|nr:hypothetical protein [Criblamydia sequanensis]CDR33495.1 hypothetical protein CSEC_0662 [Criblamydia sequanensis CRIB-18]
MNELRSSIFDTHFFLLQTVVDLANRSIDEKCFSSTLKRFITLVSTSNFSSSKSLKDSEKVNQLIEEFKSTYFNLEKPDIFSHKLMQKIIKHPKIDEDLLDCMKIMTSGIFRTFEDCNALTLQRPDNWLTHFTSTFFGVHQTDKERKLLKNMPKEMLFYFFEKKCELIKELAGVSAGDLYSSKFIANLNDTLKSLDLQSSCSSFKEPPHYTNHFLYFVYKCERFISEFTDHEENVREALMAALDDLAGQ